jgi:signal transduction histidine kinase/tetratricopeptide (TPR) repeat protein
MRKSVAVAVVLCALCAGGTGALAAAFPANETQGFERLDALIGDAKQTMMADPKAALARAREAEALASRLAPSPRQSEGVATSLWLEAEALTRTNKVAEARQVLDRAIALAGADGKITRLDGDLALTNARLADSMGNVALALKSYHDAHDIFAGLGDARHQSIALQGLGGIYDEAHDFAREIRYYREALKVYSEDPALELSVANNIGYAMQQMGRYDEALKNFQRVYDLAKLLKSDFLQSNTLSNMAAVYAKQHRFAEASRAADQALRLLGKDDENGGAPFVWGIKAEIEYERGDLDAAARNLAMAFKGVDLKTTIAPYRDMHEIAYKVYRAQGNYALAVEHLEAFKRLDDQGRSLAASANLALIGAQFDFAQQQLEIEHLKADQLKRDMSLRESRAAMQTLIFSALLLAGLVLVLWIGWRNFTMRRHRKEIVLKNTELTKTLAERDVEIERRTETEGQLRVAMEAAEQANLAKSHFLANMSHELRTPLNAIIGFSDLMAMGAAGAKIQEYAKDINTSGQNLLTILNDILDMARIDAGTVTLTENEITIGDLIEGALAEIGEDRRIARKPVRVEHGMDHVYVRGDDKRLRQILVNLLSNAFKFSGDSASVEIRVEPVRDGLDIVVSDNGIGIPSDKLGLIMEPFGQAESAYTRLHGGVGLGLPIVKSLVQLHGGRFTVESEIDRGTTARVHLPISRVINAGSDKASLHAAQ